MSEPTSCKYQSKDAQCCTQHALESGFCFWHDSSIDKKGMDLTNRLETYVRSGDLTKGLCLRGANLSGLNLVHDDSEKCFDLSEGDFYRANLQGAHLFNLCLDNGSLMKANLCEANLHCVKLRNTNLLGEKLDNAKLDNFEVGNRLLQENIALESQRNKKQFEMLDNLEQAEEVYRNLRKNADQHGLFNLAGKFSYKEILMRRLMMPRGSSQRIFSKILDLMCGYGEKPENTVTFSMLLVTIFAVFYFVLGVNMGDEILQLSVDNNLATNINHFLLTLYYSVVTFTTLGYGDITPFGFSRFFAALEAFIGSFTIALFVVVFVKRMTR